MKRILTVWMGALLFFGGAGAGTLRGWGKTWMGYDLERRIQGARQRLGPLRIQTSLSLSEAGYDSNVYSTPDRPVEDYGLTVGPALTVFWPMGRTIVFSIYESPQYVYFTHLKSERAWNNSFSGQVHFVFNKIYLSLGSGFSLDRMVWNGEVEIRPQRRQETVQGLICWQATPRSSFLAQFQRAEFKFEGLSSGEFSIPYRLDRAEDIFDLVWYRQASPGLRSRLDLQISRYGFDRVQGLKTFEGFGARGGFEFWPGGKTNGKAEVGYKSLTDPAASSRNHAGWVWDVNLSARPSNFLRARAFYRRDFQFSVWYDNAACVENTFGGGASLYPVRSVRIDLDYSSGRNEFLHQPDVLSGWPGKQEDTFVSQTAALYVRVSGNTGIGFSLNRWARNSNLAYENCRRTVVGINLTYDF